MTSKKDMVTIAVYVLRRQHEGRKYWVLTADAIQEYVLMRWEVRLPLLEILDLLD